MLNKEINVQHTENNPKRVVFSLKKSNWLFYKKIYNQSNKKVKQKKRKE